MKSIVGLLVLMSTLVSFNALAAQPENNLQNEACKGKTEGQSCSYSPCISKNHSPHCMVIVVGVCLKGVCTSGVK